MTWELVVVWLGGLWVGSLVWSIWVVDQKSPSSHIISWLAVSGICAGIVHFIYYVGK